MYGSSLTRETLILRDSRIAAREAAAMPFPREETTPPVTKTYLVTAIPRLEISILPERKLLPRRDSLRFRGAIPGRLRPGRPGRGDLAPRMIHLGHEHRVGVQPAQRRGADDATGLHVAHPM